jgi:transposase InsO family protein
MNVADPLSRAPTLLEQPVEELHDGLALVHVSDRKNRIEPLAVETTTPPVRSPNLPATTTDEDMEFVGQTREASLAAVSTHAWLMILSSIRGRLQLGGGEALRIIAATTRGQERRGQELSDTPMDTELDSTMRGVTPNSNEESNETSTDKSMEVIHADTPPYMGRSGASEKHTKGQNTQGLSETASGSGEMDVESLTELVNDESGSMHTGSMAEQLEVDSEMQGLLTEFLDLVKEGYQKDDWFAELANTKALLRDLQGLYWKGHKLVIPDYAQLRRQCMKLCHDAPWAGHFGRDRTQKLVRQLYWWPKMDAEIEAYVKTCPACQRNKSSTAKAYGLMVPTQIPTRRWSSISTDFIIHLPRTSRGNDAIVQFVDRLSKRVHLVATRTKSGAEEFAEIFVKHIFANHGLPQEIISDRDRKFLSGFWEKVTELLGVRRCLSTAFHPQTDGQTERMNRTLEEVLRSFVAPDQSDWDEKLPLIEFAMNNSVNASTGTTPFLMEYGQEPLTPASLPIARINSKAFKFVANWESRVKDAKRMLQEAQHRQKSLYDRKVQEKQFEVGQWVMVSTRNMKMKGSKTVRRKKLTAKYAGPFKVRRRIGIAAYDLELPAHVKIHPVFHVGLLKEFYSDKYRAEEAPVVEFEDGEEYYIMKQIIGERNTGIAKLTEFLIRWENGDESWEYEDDLMEDAPRLLRSLIRKFRGKGKQVSENAKPDDKPKRPVGRPPGSKKRPRGRPRKNPSID